MHALADELAQKFDAGLNGTMESMEFDMLPPERDEEPIAQIEPEPFMRSSPPDARTRARARPRRRRRVPEWEPSPERKPVERRSDVHEPIGPERRQRIHLRLQEGRHAASARADAVRTTPPESAERLSAPDFPIPEFGVPIGRGPAARAATKRSTAREQHSNFREIMDENFEHPPRRDRRGRDHPGRPRWPPAPGRDRQRPEQAAPRIVHPGRPRSR